MAAINADAGLRARILRRAAATLKVLRTTSSGEGGGQASPPVQAYKDGASAIFLLCALRQATNWAARDVPGFSEEVMAGAELFLRLDPPPEVGQHRLQQVYCNAIFALHAMLTINLDAAGQPVLDHFLDFGGALRWRWSLASGGRRRASRTRRQPSS